MPLVVFDIVQGRTADQIAAILDATHAAMLESFGVPARDQYQIINEHEPSHFGRAGHTSSASNAPRTSRLGTAVARRSASGLTAPDSGRTVFHPISPSSCDWRYAYGSCPGTRPSPTPVTDVNPYRALRSRLGECLRSARQHRLMFRQPRHIASDGEQATSQSLPFMMPHARTRHEDCPEIRSAESACCDVAAGHLEDTVDAPVRRHADGAAAPADLPAALFHFSPDHRGEHPQRTAPAGPDCCRPTPVVATTNSTAVSASPPRSLRPGIDPD